MKKKLLTILLFLAMLCSVGLVACNEDNDSSDKQILAVYNTYVAYAEDNGTTPLSYEEWLSTIKGQDGANGLNGNDGLGVKSVVVNTEGHLVITYTDDTFVDAGLVRGSNGQKGDDGVSVADMKIENGKLYVKYSNSDTYVELGQVEGASGSNGQKGDDGVSVADMKIENGKLYVKYSNSDTYVDLGQVKGDNGSDAKQIKGAEIDVNGNLIITYNDNTTDNLGKIKDNSKCEHQYSDYIITEIGDVGYRKEYYCTKCHESKSELYIYTDGIEYALAEDGNSAYVKSIGTATDTEIVLRSTYQDKPVTEIANSAFRNCNKIQNIIISDSITTINYYAFSSCYSLKSITIGRNVTNIGEHSFSWCPNLSEVTIPDSVISIDSAAFACCQSLTSITLGNSVTNIGDYAFSSCTSLTSLIIPNGVTSIGSDAFINCTSLQYNEYDNACYLGNNTNPYVVLVKAKSTSITSCLINSNCKYIYNYAFQDSYLQGSIEIPDSVTSIGHYAFYGRILSNITIYDSVTNIGSNVFPTNCSSLQYNEYGNGYYLGNSTNPYVVLVKAKSTSMTSCTISSACKIICPGAFSGCHKLVEVINLSSLNITKGSENNGCAGYYALNVKTSGTSDIVETDDGYLFYTYNSINYLLGYTGTDTCLTLHTDYNGQSYEIYKYAFYCNRKLESVIIPDSITSIGEYAFSNCTSLNKVYYKGNAEQWNSIEIGDYNTNLISATRYYYSETEPADNVYHYWYYDTDGVTIKEW